MLIYTRKKINYRLWHTQSMLKYTELSVMGHCLGIYIFAQHLRWCCHQQLPGHKKASDRCCQWLKQKLWKFTEHVIQQILAKLKNLRLLWLTWSFRKLFREESHKIMNLMSCYITKNSLGSCLLLCLLSCNDFHVRLKDSIKKSLDENYYSRPSSV